MKISCILLSLMCVNVLANISITEYINMVELLNLQIQKASGYNDDYIGNGLERVIEGVLRTNCSPSRYVIEMFTVPELALTYNFDYLQDSILTQTDNLQQELFQNLGIPIVYPNKSNEILRITTLGKTRTYLTGKALHNLHKQIIDIPALDDKNQTVTKHNDIDKRSYKATRRATIKLTELGKARRLLTKKAIKNVLTQALAELISYDKKHCVYTFCTLIALWISSKTASIPIVSVDHEGDDIEICVVYDKDRNAVKYRPFMGIYWQVNVNKTDTKIEELNVQLLDDSSIPRFKKSLTTTTFKTRYMNDMFTIPEHSIISSYEYLQDSILTQENLQRIIFQELRIPKPAKATESNAILRTTTDGKARSFLTGKALKKLHSRIVNIPVFDDKNQSVSVHSDKFKRIYKPTRRAINKLTKLGKARRLFTGKAIRNALIQHLDGWILNEKMYSVNRICTLIAMWLSLKTSSKTDYDVQHIDRIDLYRRIDICVVYDGAFNAVAYRLFKDKYWQVNVNKMDKKIIQLKVQLFDDSSIPRFEKQLKTTTF
ncbi:uncharacterized protein LOC126839808 [Adelges cooleyi]|uniref:uncharacterized protein LOC126839808 n=1 Tax=Adelges cooleyi TaxID=133065 RepID=UPI00217FFFB6|nr:uncharacterized protein LOC126839808 [Adelges cooleyi]